MSRSIVKEEAFYEEHFIRHLAWMLRQLESSDVTSLGPELASGAAADRSDVYSGSVSVKGWLFTSESLHPAAPIDSPCIQYETEPTDPALDSYLQVHLVGNSLP